jgi:hypothetical protein
MEKKETAVERQSRVQRMGREWEDYVESFLNDQLKGTGLTVIKGDKVERNTPLWRKLSIPTKASTAQESLWGDIDIVILKDDIVVAVVSCKLSLHGRFTETLFYGVLFRMWSRTKFVLVTPDAGRGQKGPVWKSEWGTPEKPTKDRMLAESYLAAVYVENLEKFCPKKKPTECTSFGGIVRHIEELPNDLKRWADEDAKFIYPGKQKTL